MEKVCIIYNKGTNVIADILSNFVFINKTHIQARENTIINLNLEVFEYKIIEVSKINYYENAVEEKMTENEEEKLINKTIYSTKYQLTETSQELGVNNIFMAPSFTLVPEIPRTNEEILQEKVSNLETLILQIGGIVE